MRHNLILRVVAGLLIPFILLFALYVQFHGDFGPGGGFQAGVIFAAAFILFSLVFGVQAAQHVVSPSLLRVLAAAGVLIYGGVGVATLIRGGAYLDYSALARDAVAGQHWGIFLVEFGVGVTVASVMIIIYFAYAGRGD